MEIPFRKALIELVALCAGSHSSSVELLLVILMTMTSGTPSTIGEQMWVPSKLWIQRFRHIKLDKKCLSERILFLYLSRACVPVSNPWQIVEGVKLYFFNGVIVPRW